MSKPAPREWTLYSHYSTDNDAMKWSTTRDSEITLEVEKPERIKVIERSAYDRLAEENKILREAIKNMQGILSPNRKGHHVSGCETRAIDVGFTALSRVEGLE